MPPRCFTTSWGAGGRELPSMAIWAKTISRTQYSNATFAGNTSSGGMVACHRQHCRGFHAVLWRNNASSSGKPAIRHEYEQFQIRQSVLQPAMVIGFSNSMTQVITYRRLAFSVPLPPKMDWRTNCLSTMRSVPVLGTVLKLAILVDRVVVSSYATGSPQTALDWAICVSLSSETAVIGRSGHYRC